MDEQVVKKVTDIRDKICDNVMNILQNEGPHPAIALDAIASAMLSISVSILKNMEADDPYEEMAYNLREMAAKMETEGLVRQVKLDANLEEN